MPLLRCSNSDCRSTAAIGRPSDVPAGWDRLPEDTVVFCCRVCRWSSGDTLDPATGWFWEEDDEGNWVADAAPECYLLGCQNPARAAFQYVGPVVCCSERCLELFQVDFEQRLLAVGSSVEGAEASESEWHEWDPPTTRCWIRRRRRGLIGCVMEGQPRIDRPGQTCRL
jgi:hypothetical protein